MIIPESYYAEEKNIKLTQYEIDLVINNLEGTEHNTFVFLKLDKIIAKLNQENIKNAKRNLPKKKR